MSSNSKKDNSNNLPPNVSSNKYSKKRNWFDKHPTINHAPIWTAFSYISLFEADE